MTQVGLKLLRSRGWIAAVSVMLKQCILVKLLFTLVPYTAL